MASERQIAANRRNGRKSKGPRSAVGKIRSSRNARRHGFSSKSWRAEMSEAIERKAREICADLSEHNEVTLERARTVAEAMVQLQQLRAAKLSLIEQVIEYGMIPWPRDMKAERAQINWRLTIIKSLEEGRGGQELLDPLPQDIALWTMPAEQPERSFEAIRRVLVQLARLERYEKRAAYRRGQAVRSLFAGSALRQS